jgi:hypothetical protein
MMTKPPTLDDVLETIMLEEEEPTHAAMNRWVARHPEYKTQLVSFFGTWAIQSEQTEESPTVDSEALASRGVSYALNLLHKREAPQSLLERTQIAGLSVEHLAAQTRLDDSILQKLNLRRLSNVPRECVRRLASALGDTLECIRQLITGPPALAVGRRYKAHKKPTSAQQEDFLTAVKSSSLSEADQDDWCNIIAAEKNESTEPE